MYSKSAFHCAVSILALASANSAQAQSAVPESSATTPAQPVDDIIVTGIRRSLIDSIAIKRDTQGVVDAITSEDIGKLPDTNLAESIQRIPGVTIDRNNNEGSRITVRGFGPEFNLTTLNGRSLPGSSLDGNATRSFDFADISSDGIAGINVYKTGRADIASGGIGSTVDILTARPFDYKKLTLAVQAKGTDDLSRHGFHVTPDVSGIVSDTFADGRIGILLNGSYSVRDSRLESTNIGGWLQNQFTPGQAGVTSSNTNPAGNTWAPRNENWGVDTHHRKRINGQAVLQFKPTDTIVATADYTYALYDDRVVKNSYGAWFDYGASPFSAKIDKNGTVTDLVDTGSDLSYSTFDSHPRSKLNSVGGNLKWNPIDNLSFAVDGHHSTDVSGGPTTFMILGQDPRLSDQKIFTSVGSTVPTTLFTYKPPYNLATLDTTTITPLFAQALASTLRSTIDEINVVGEWKNNSDGGLRSIRFGGNVKNSLTQFTAFSSFLPLGFYDPTSDGLIPASVFNKVSSCTIDNGISGTGCQNKIPYYFTYDLNAAAKALQGKYPTDYSVPTNPATDNRIKEKVQSLFVVTDFATDFNDMQFKAQVGLRYEHTNTTARSLQQVPASITWVNPTEFRTNFLPGAQLSDIRRHYDDFLPSIDTSLAVTSKLLLRASYSKTIARSDLNSLVGTQSVSQAPKPGQRTILAGNPGLLPYESDNIDLAAEYYFKRGSLLSVNFFSKHVNNFLTQTTSQTTLPGITDPSQGAIAQRATAEVIAAGGVPSPQNIFNQALLDTGQPPTGSFTGQPGDPLVSWDITRPTNANTVNLHGFELSAQHIFDQLGFGFQANVSLPVSGTKFNPQIITTQFALPGLSKSYNLVAFYEKYGFQARLAYTYRSAFLSGLGQAQGSGGEPTYTRGYGQLDGSAAYDVNAHLSIFVDAINITGASQFTYGRYSNQFLAANKGYGRYQVGARFKL